MIQWHFDLVIWYIICQQYCLTWTGTSLCCCWLISLCPRAATDLKKAPKHPPKFSRFLEARRTDGGTPGQTISVSWEPNPPIQEIQDSSDPVHFDEMSWDYPQSKSTESLNPSCPTGFLEGKAVIRNQLERFPGKANETYVTCNFSNPAWNQYDF